ncbi:MAG TPA: copper chaperone [Rhodobacteraceae bacterium]|nr:copper chaperone [Paracoccaceae bacterium]
MSRFSVPDMSCGHCKAKIEDALLEADGGAELGFDMDAREVTVDSVLEANEIVDTIKGAGYEAARLG